MLPQLGPLALQQDPARGVETQRADGDRYDGALDLGEAERGAAVAPRVQRPRRAVAVAPPPPAADAELKEAAGAAPRGASAAMGVSSRESVRRSFR